jgi:FAD/FMN-containing dehydrogenase
VIILNLQLNDVHSRLNSTHVAGIERPHTLADLQATVHAARSQGLKISVAGGRHAMGGQQFGDRSLHIDTTALQRVLGQDAQRGLLHMEAGAFWPAIMQASHAVPSPGGHGWGIRQKQTGVDDVSLAGSISANAHGRGLLMQPMVDDIEDITLVDAQGHVQRCSREQQPELFALVVGGYGLFGLIYSATLRLAPRQRVRRLVDVLDLQDAMAAVRRRVEQGCLYGDFQFVIDPSDAGFLQRGVFACYIPLEQKSGKAPDSPAGDGSSDLSEDAWLKLLQLAHDDKALAFKLYAQHYLGTHGNDYWADTMQLSTYIPSYAEYLERARVRPGEDSDITSPKESLVIGEHYVPPDQLGPFMQQAAALLRASGCEVIYGTIRAIQRDTTTFLPWAKDDFACVIFNLRTPHTPDGLARTAQSFSALIDLSTRLGGSFFLTYHRHATTWQVQACYPQFQTWLALKKQHDPTELFCSNWYAHYRDAFASQAPSLLPAS